MPSDDDSSSPYDRDKFGRLPGNPLHGFGHHAELLWEGHRYACVVERGKLPAWLAVRHPDIDRPMPFRYWRPAVAWEYPALLYDLARFLQHLGDCGDDD